MGTTTKKSLMSFLFPILFCLSFVLGQFGRIDLFGGAMYLHEIVLLGGILFYFRDIWNLKWTYPIRNFFPMIGFVIAIVISILFAVKQLDIQSIFIPLSYLIRFLLYSSLMFLVPISGGVKTWIKTIVIAGSLFTLGGLIQFFLYPDLRNISYLGWDPHFMRFVSTVFDPNIAGFMLLSFFVMTLLNFETQGNWKKVVGIVLLIETFAVILTFSRSTLMTFVIVMLVYSILKKKWWPMVIAIGVGILSIVCMPLGSLSSPMRIVSALARADNFVYGFNLFLSKPLTGVGWFMVSAFDVTSVEVTRAFARIDNSFMFVLTSTGIIGFSLFLWFLSKIWILVKKTYQKTLTRTYGMFFGLVLLTLLVHTQFENIFFSAWGLTWFWMTVGLLLDIGEKKRQEALIA